MMGVVIRGVGHDCGVAGSGRGRKWVGFEFGVGGIGVGEVGLANHWGLGEWEGLKGAWPMGGKPEGAWPEVGGS